MRKVLMLTVIGWMLAAGVPASYAMEREQPVPPASAPTLVTVTRAVTAGSADGIRIQQPEHERQ